MAERTFLPLPEGVLPLEEGPEGYRLQRAGERGYVVISGFVQAAFVVTGEGVILVDAPPAGRHRLGHRPAGDPLHLHPLSPGPRGRRHQVPRRRVGC